MTGAPDTLALRNNLESTQPMKRSVLVFILTASTVIAIAQTPAKPTTAAKSATAARPATAGMGVKLPPGVPPARGIVKSAFTLRYQDIKLGTGAIAEPNKMYKVLYTGWLAADGHAFDSSNDHRVPVKDKDGKPVMGADGKPKLGEAQPISVPQGFGRVIPGFDQGFYGMRQGGKRRLFIPWQLAYGARGRQGPDAAHPGIPPKADLIFDIELVDVSDLQMPPNHPGGMAPGIGQPGRPMNMPGRAPGMPVAPGAPLSPTSPGTSASPATPPASTTPPPASTVPPNSTPAPPSDKPKPQ